MSLGFRGFRVPWLFPFLLAMILSSGLAAKAQAVPFDNKPKLLLVPLPIEDVDPCRRRAIHVPTDCQQLSTSARVATPGVGPFYYIYLMVAPGPYRALSLGGDGSGIAGLQCGLQYNAASLQGVDILGWHLCGSFEFTDSGVWPASGSGTLISFDSTSNCQTTELGTAGYFYCAAYSTDRLELTVRPVDGQAKLAKCNGTEVPLAPSDLGFVQFSSSGTLPGCNPCNISCTAPVTVQSTTWGRLKTLRGF